MPVISADVNALYMKHMNSSLATTLMLEYFSSYLQTGMTGTD